MAHIRRRRQNFETISIEAIAQIEILGQETFCQEEIRIDLEWAGHKSGKG